MRRLALIGMMVGALALSGCGSHFLFGEQPDHSKVSHKVHIEQSVDCDTCHDRITKVTALGEKGIFPKEDVCQSCHDDTRPTDPNGKDAAAKRDCTKCHTNPEHAGGHIPVDYHLHMNHAAHVPRVKGDCRVCHQVLPEPKQTYTPPTMDACLTCHNHQQDFDNGKCELCHTDLVHYPENPVGTFSHQSNWVKLHQTAARSTTESCSTCHDSTFCSSCHDAPTAPVRVEMRFPEHVEGDFQIHRGDWLSRHSLDAQADESSCRRCHGTPFCTSCHAQQNLTTSAANHRNPHPPGWAFPGATSHANAARADIASCQACHDQGAASNCVTCHKVGGIGGNPHPSSFLSRHHNSEIKQNAMCLYCHL